ncbi:nucleolar MIF4G domain-containing protein 1 homolog [Nomia melanderi]|uniref:nucleolar MIF4G domain-containing protein 1 homolog n=1 Tax=Nomia melanderi TaxID=2448451 RepID=UPI0013044F4A|nr:nucleolar MIF4G domain-containing protein 1 homolog [Nomia melanderi]
MGSFKRLNPKNKSTSLQKSRKQIRKELRKQKKISKANHFKKRNELRVSGQHANTHVDNDNTNDEVVNDFQVKFIKKKEKEVHERKKKNKENEFLTKANQKEDKMIRKLEKQLKMNKKKKTTIPKSFKTDGLDYILDFCLQEDRKCIVDAEEELVENKYNNEFKTDLSMVLEETDTETMERDDEENRNDSDSSTHAPKCFSRNNNLNRLKIDKVKLDTKQDKMCNNIDDTDNNIWEDIYGRKRDREGNIIHEHNKYTFRDTEVNANNAINKDNEKLLFLKRKLKGCLNRIAEQNMHIITNQIEELYLTNGRNDMNCLLTNLIFEAVIARVLTPNRLICEYMMLIAILHANIGIEIGAHFLEKLVKKFIEIMDVSQNVEDKELDNVILMISHLYNFKVYGYKLLYQILDRLTTKFTEKEIDLILLILRTVGFVLRKDDPIALKEFIQNLQKIASHKNEQSSRFRFLLDVLLAIKNNNISKIPQYDPSHVEHLKKVIKNVIRKGNTITQFNVSLEDLLHADENGKWWIVGSAWVGSNMTSNQDKVKQENKFRFGKKILELAEKQRMNTDTRRNIFCILMTAEDYVDAFENLHHLGLKDQQEDEIIHVLIHCCLQENKFNPYYAVLAQKFCEYNRKYQLTLQYALWDKLKSLNTHGRKQLSNLARFLTYLFTEKCLALSVLKVIQFTELDRYTMKLLREIILGILLHKNEQVCLQTFERISISPQLQTFRESLRLFIQYFLIKNIDSSGTLNEKEVTLKRRAELVDKIIVSHGTKIKF